MTLADDLFHELELLVGESCSIGEGFNGASDGDTTAMRRAADRGIPLADFEDDQGRLPHDEEARRMKTSSIAGRGGETKPCMFCGVDAPAFGRYAGRCVLHRHYEGGNGVTEGMTEKQAAEALAPHTGNVTVLDGEIPPSERIVVDDDVRELLGEPVCDDPGEELVRAATLVAEAKKELAAAELRLVARLGYLVGLAQQLEAGS